MKAAIVMAAGEVPSYGDFADPEHVPGKSLIRVTAASISQVARSRAAGRHHSDAGHFPVIPGVDGAGVAEDGQPVYFFLPDPPYGAMAEMTRVTSSQVVRIPDALDPVSAAAMAVPGMSSWAALVERARLQRGETVLINGATGVSGRLAIQVARHLGAGKIIATGRQLNAFGALRQLGADVTIPLVQPLDALEAAFRREFHQRVDVVLDYVWGPSAQVLIGAAARESAEGVPVRYVQVGSASGLDVTLPGAALRSCALQLMGCGMGSVPRSRLIEAFRGVLNAAPKAGLTVHTAVMPLAEVRQAWDTRRADARIVLVP